MGAVPQLYPEAPGFNLSVGHTVVPALLKGSNMLYQGH